MDYDKITDIHCHGGLTFSEFDKENEDAWVIDWGSDNGKKYNVKEILEDVYNVIDQIKYNNTGDKK